jgi:phosphate uptake regulator
MRRLQATAGGSTYTLSLPKQWVEERRIKAGQYLTISEMPDGRLMILPRVEKAGQKKKGTVNVAGKPFNTVVREMLAYYVDGYDIIEFAGKNLGWETRKELKETIRKLMLGVEVMEEDEKGLSAQCVIDVSELSVKKIVRRGFNIFDWMYERTMQAMIDRDRRACTEVIERDNDVDRLTLLAIRQLAEAAKSPEFAAKIEIAASEAPDYRIIADYLETMADCCVAMTGPVERIIEMKLPSDALKEFYDLAERVKKQYKNAAAAFLSDDGGLGNEAAENYAWLREFFSGTMAAVFKKVHDRPEAIAPLTVMTENLMRITELTKGMAEIAIDRALRPKMP